MQPRSRVRPDLSEFSRDMGVIARTSAIQRRFPEAGQRFKEYFDSDIELFGHVVRDILRLQHATPGRPGPRPGLDPALIDEFDKYMGEDYTLLPFDEAFKALAGGRSLRHLEAKTGINYKTVQRLLNGSAKPDMETMEQVAVAFKKRASYFLEWRLEFVTRAITERLRCAPEASVNLYEKITAQG